MGVLARLGRVRRRARDRWERRRTVRDRAALLRPGRYRRTGPELWSRLPAELPAHLERTKGWTDGSARRPWSRAADGFRVPGRSGADDGYVHALVTYDGGVVLLDPDGGRVARWDPRRPFTAAYAERRTRLARHLACPAFEVADDGALLVEDFVPGRHVLDLPAAGQVDVVRRVVDAFAGLVEHERTTGDAGARVVRRAWELAAGAVTDPDLVDVLARVPDELAGGRWPCVPAPTDATVRNLVVAADGVPRPIDLGEIREDPFFLYPLGLLLNARPHGLDAYLAGELDDDLARLFAAAGTPWSWTAEGRLALVALRTAVVALQEAGGAASADVDERRLADALQTRWRRIRARQPVER